MIAVTITGMLAVLAVPSVQHARGKAERTSCQSNLRLLNNAAQEYLFVNPTPGTLVPTDLQQYFLKEEIPVCPAGGDYTVYTDPKIIPTCSQGPGLGHAIEIN